MKSLYASAPMGATVLACLAVSACSGDQVDRQDGLLGFGTPGVSTYMSGAAATDLQDELDHCRGVSVTSAASQTQSLEAACEQLLRTMHNQPGNSIQPSVSRNQ